MPSDGIIESVDIASNGLCSLVSGLEACFLYELGLDGLEECLNHSIVIAISLA